MEIKAFYYNMQADNKIIPLGFEVMQNNNTTYLTPSETLVPATAETLKNSGYFTDGIVPCEQFPSMNSPIWVKEDGKSHYAQVNLQTLDATKLNEVVEGLRRQALEFNMAVYEACSLTAHKKYKAEEEEQERKQREEQERKQREEQQRLQREEQERLQREEQERLQQQSQTAPVETVVTEPSQPEVGSKISSDPLAEGKVVEVPGSLARQDFGSTSTTDLNLGYEFEMSKDVHLPMFKKVSQDTSYLMSKTLENLRQRIDHSPKLKFLNTQQITTRGELEQFIRDFLEGNTTAVNDIRHAMNMNWYVDRSLLHNTFAEYKKDKLVHQYINRKARVPYDAYRNIMQMFEKISSPLLSPTALFGLDQLIKLMPQMSAGLEHFMYNLNFFVEEPIEMLETDYAVTGITNVRAFLNTPWTNISPDSQPEDIFDNKHVIVPIVDGKMDSSKYRGPIKEYETNEHYARARLFMLNPEFRVQDRSKYPYNVSCTTNGSYTVEDFNTNEVIISTKYNEIAYKDASIPHAFFNGLHDGLSVEDAYLVRQAKNLIRRYVIPTERNAFEALRLNGISSPDYVNLTVGANSIGNPTDKKESKDKKKERQSIEEDIYGLYAETSAGDLIENEDDVKVFWMEKLALEDGGMFNDAYTTYYLGMKKGLVLIAGEDGIISQLSARMDLTSIGSFVEMSVLYGYREASDLLKAISTFGHETQSIDFGNNIIYKFNYDKSIHNNFINRVIEAYRVRALESRKSEIEILTVITDMGMKKILGYGFKSTLYSSTNKNKVEEISYAYDSGLYIRAHMLQGACAITNGYLLEDDFIPLDRDADIPVKRILLDDITELPTPQLDHRGKTVTHFSTPVVHASQANHKVEQMHLTNYIERQLKPALANARVDGKIDQSKFIEPPTTMESMMGITQSMSQFVENYKAKKEGRKPEQVRNFFGLGDKTFKELEQEQKSGVAEVQQQPVQEPVQQQQPVQEPVQEQQPVQEPVQEQQPVQQPVQEQSAPLTEQEPSTQQHMPQTTSSHRIVGGKEIPVKLYTKGKVSFEVTHLIYAVRTASEITDDLIPVGVIGNAMQVREERTITQVTKASLAELVKWCQLGYMNVPNAEISFDTVSFDSTSDIKQISIFDRVVAMAKVFNVKNNVPTESIINYVKNLGDAQSTGKFPEHPSEIAIKQFKESSIAPEKVTETIGVIDAVLAVNRKNQDALSKVYESLLPKEHNYKLIGHTKTHFICEVTKEGRVDNQLLSKADLMGSIQKLGLLGFTQVGPNYLVKDVNGRLVVFDESLNEVL